MNRRFYAVLFRLYRRIFPTPAWEGRIPRESLRRVLVVRHDHIGDMVVTTPLLTFLKEAAGAREVDVLASPKNAAVLAGDERVARVFTNDHTWPGWLRVLPRLRARRYDAIFSVIYGRGLREGLTASLIATRRTYKVSVWRPKRYRGFFTTVARAPVGLTHMADQLLHLGEYALGTRIFGARAERYPMRLAADPTAEARAAAFLSAHGLEQFVAVNLAATDQWREWRPDRCAEFLTLLLRRHQDLSVVLTPPPGKEEPTAEAARRCADPRVLVAPSSSRIQDLAALIRRALVVVTPDTGNIHIASACGRPVLALYTPRSVHLKRWLPWGVPYRTAVSAARGGISDIPPEDVARAFDDLRRELDECGAATPA